MPLADPLDSSAVNGFIVTIDGIQVPKVVEITGIKQEVDKIEHKQQNAQGQYIIRNIMGRPKSGEFTVTRGLTDSKTISSWLKTVMQGDIKGSRKTAAVQFLDYLGKPLQTFNFVNCWISSFEVSGMKAGSTDIATEKFTVVYDEMTVA